MSIDGSCASELFSTTEIQEPLESGDAADARGDALDSDTLTAEYLEQDPEPEVGVSDEDGDECDAAESDKEIVGDRTLHQSPMKNLTRSKSQKVVVPEPLLPSDFEDEGPRPQPRKRNSASPASLSAGGHAIYFRRDSNQIHPVPKG